MRRPEPTIKPDELAALKALAAAGPYEGGVAMRVLNALGTHPNRGYRLAEKWERKFCSTNDPGWEYGVSLRSGWLTPDGHKTLLEYLRRLGHWPEEQAA